MSASPTIAMLRLAASLHRDGKLEQAETLYAQILRADPGQSDALHLWGLVARQRGNMPMALELIGKAIRINPRHAAAHFNLGNVLLHMGRYTDAIRSYDRALRIQPDLAGAHSNRGNVLRTLGRLDEALASYENALKHAPSLVEALAHRAGVLKALGRLEESLQAYDLLLRLHPGSAAACNDRGVLLESLGRADDAMLAYERALEISPDFAEALVNRGNMFMKQRQPDAALPDYDRAIALRPGYAEAMDNRGCALESLGNLEEALAAHDAALRIRPRFPTAHNNRGNVLRKLGRLDEALESYEQAVAANPDFAQAHNNRGIALCDLQRFDEALASYSRALDIQPDYADVHFNESLCRLLMGDYARGLPKFEWRWRRRNAPAARQTDRPLWLGQTPLNGKTILLHAEQGLGDSIQFCRYARNIAEQGAAVILEVPATLQTLFESLPGVEHLVVQGAPLPRHDYHCPLMSLPLALDTSIETIPGDTPYLRAPASRTIAWKLRLGPRTKPRVGLAWSGRAGYQNDHLRSINASDFFRLASGQAEFFCLQDAIRSTDRTMLETRTDIATFSKELVDFAETAALLANMDLVISVDTSIAHLAGAMGKPVWILLPFRPDWRWMIGRRDSPWYPSATLFRQSEPGNWENVIADVAQALEQWCDMPV